MAELRVEFTIHSLQRRRALQALSGSMLALTPLAHSQSYRQGLGRDLTLSKTSLSIQSVSVPADVIAAVKAAKNLAIFNVSQNETFAENVLKCDELVFSPRGQLTLTNWGSSKAPFLAIVAKRWKFSAPQERALIQRPPGLLAAKGGNGGPGPRGQDGPADDMAGSPGGQGGTGAIGETVHLPPLYLFGERTVDQPGNPIPWMNLVIVANGILGGDGGRGGVGGNGGNGASGHPGSDSLVDCKRGPGDGGAGGPGGSGGVGGQAGIGGDGATVYYVGSQNFIDIITFANLINVGGPAGLPGGGGRGGNGGNGGPRGTNTFYCKGGSPGPDGRDGPQGASGPTSPDGKKGSADISVRASLADLY